MEVLGIIIGAVATLIGIIAGIVQVTQYLQERAKEKTSKKEELATKTIESNPTNEPKQLLIKHNLPHRKKFIGREKEIKKILAVLRPYPYSQEHLITIDGVGGVGKSALAIEIAHILMSQYSQRDASERFDAIIWTSAQRNLLSTDGIVSRPQPQIIRTLDQIYTTMAVTLDHSDTTRLKTSEQFDVIRNSLTTQRTLLIVDNLETIDDEEIISFLRELPAPTKAIITSRHRIDVAYPIRLLGMEAEESEALIKNECARKEITIPDIDSRKLINRTGGVPLAMILSIAQVAKGFGMNAVLDRLGKPTDDIARYCFDFSFENLSVNAWKLLMALSMFSAGTSREIIGEVTELSELDRDETLVELEKLSLINRSTNKFWMLPLSLEYVQSKMIGERKDIVAKLKHNFAKAYMNIKIETMESAKINILAVHLAIDLSDIIAWDTKIADYLSANRRAIYRGVTITRIFVLERKFTYLLETDKHLHPEIQRILDEQMQIGIDIRILWWETIWENKLTEPADLIIFDGREVHVHTGHGGWYLDVEIPTDLEEIKLWQKRFSQWLEYSVVWYIMRREEGKKGVL